jgi:hypothetical protein
VTITVRTLVLGVTGFLLVTVGGIVLLVRGGEGPQRTLLEPGVPIVVSADHLDRLSGTTAPIYWAGSFPGRRLEVTTTKSGSFVRYLPPATRVGTNAKTLTIATYPVAGAWQVAQQAGQRRGARVVKLPDGRIAVWRTSKPTSVYLASPGSNTLVEVFDPSAAKAHNLSVSGLVQPVPRAG